MASNVKRYNSNSPQLKHTSGSALQWMVCPTLCGKVGDYFLLCSQCGEEVEKGKVSEHCTKIHQGQRCKVRQDFDWVKLRIGKLHLEINMARHLND